MRKYRIKIQGHRITVQFKLAWLWWNIYSAYSVEDAKAFVLGMVRYDNAEASPAKYIYDTEFIPIKEYK